MNFPLPVTLPVCLAPMVGLSHRALRDVMESYMPAGTKTIWPSEMLNSRRIPDEDLSKIPEAMHREGEEYWVPQILGNEERPIRLSLKKLEDYGAHGVDINMGCPVKKALRHNYGVALMGDADYAARVVEMAAQNTKLPVSVKLRAGLEKDVDKLLAFIKKLESAGAQWITLHPRTAAQKRRGKADWSQIKFIKENLSIPVIGNGDIQTVEDVDAMFSQTGCDMVMAGRAFTARPWLFWQWGHKQGLPAPLGREGPPPMTASEEGVEYIRCCQQVFESMREHFRETVGVRKFLFYIKTSGVWLDFGHHIFSRVSACRSYADVEQTLAALSESTVLHMHEKTELRE